MIVITIVGIVREVIHVAVLKDISYKMTTNYAKVCKTNVGWLYDNVKCLH